MLFLFPTMAKCWLVQFFKIMTVSCFVFHQYLLHPSAFTKTSGGKKLATELQTIMAKVIVQAMIACGAITLAMIAGGCDSITQLLVYCLIFFRFPYLEFTSYIHST